MSGTADLNQKLNAIIKHVKQLEKDVLAMKEVLMLHLDKHQLEENPLLRLDPGEPLNGKK